MRGLINGNAKDSSNNDKPLATKAASTHYCKRQWKQKARVLILFWKEIS
jgi:hypothetical protein